MNNLDGGRSIRPWNYYPSQDIPLQIAKPPQVQIQSNNNYYKEGGQWKNFGPATSINAISFGFVATAILISMFLIMAIIEHLFRPTNDPSNSLLSSPNRILPPSSGSSAKSRNHHNMVKTIYERNYSVVMPGQKYPTCIAQPAPLLPCPREGYRYASCPS